ncbi:MAG TPA: prolyl oligopeptidase family serine peptidase [Armatimonadaceae bacterium]|nr:prolyl oligopeptidase family serine peptidase [Armatimonadaceae bacterium]
MTPYFRLNIITLLGLALTVAAYGTAGPARAQQQKQNPMTNLSRNPAGANAPATRTAYPKAHTGDVADEYHGVRVRDPYRWLEDADAAETKEWVEAQNRVTADYLRGVPSRGAIGKRLTKLWDYEKFGMPYKKGDRYFFTRNDGLQNQSVLYVADSLTGKARVLLDPNKLSGDGTVALSGTAISEDGKYLAYGLAAAGSDWQEWRVRDVATGEDRPGDHLRWIKFGGASWAKDGSGFYYSRYDEPKDGGMLQAANFNQKVFFHRLGDDQEKDALVYERPDHPNWFLFGGVTEDGKYLLIYASEGTDPKNRIYIKDLTQRDAPVKPLLDAGDASYSVIDNDGDTFYVSTDRDAPRYRVVAVDRERPAPEAWKEIIPQNEDTLQGVSLLGDDFYATYLKDAATRIQVYDLKGKPVREVPLPGIGSAGGFGGKRTDTETFYSFTSFTTPTTIYRYDLKTHTATVFKQAKVAFDPADYETKQVFYASKDGTRVPLFLTHRKGLKLDGTAPTYLYGYGGFGAAMTPYFSVAAQTWMEMGGVYAVACLRGGGEYGEDWHQAGVKLKKQNVFDDFIAAAEWLVENKYTSPKRLAIAGGSNGGLLVGACMTQRPDLFGAALPAVGVMDMLRFPKFTIGWAWMSDYGSPENPEEFKALYAYSPYHNLKPGTRYPATLITTSDHDDRVVPAHSYKFAAALQAAQDPDGPPTLIRVETRAGHGAGKPTAKIIDEIADTYAFLVRALDIDVPESFGKGK